MDDSPWDDNASLLQDAEWSKLSTNFTNAGYREGLTAGKEAALQAGFDEGFAEVGGPLGKEIGQARGMASAMLWMVSLRGCMTDAEAELQALVAELGGLPISEEGRVRVGELGARLADIMREHVRGNT